MHPQRCQAALADIPELPVGNRISYEPGGQLELSSLPWPDLGGCVQRLDRDIAAVVGLLAASTQVNLEAGPESQWRRWELARVLGPMLVAAFANSPMLGGRITGWRSTRQAIWSALGPARIQRARPLGQRDPVAAWTSYALSARMMLRRQQYGVIGLFWTEARSPTGSAGRRGGGPGRESMTWPCI